MKTDHIILVVLVTGILLMLLGYWLDIRHKGRQRCDA